MHRFVLISLASFVLSGCFAWDELKQSEALLDAHSPTAKRMREEEVKKALAEADVKKGPTVSERTKDWWDNAGTLSRLPDQSASADPMVSCRLGDSVRFTKQTDCLSRGGRVGKL